MAVFHRVSGGGSKTKILNSPCGWTIPEWLLGCQGGWLEHRVLEYDSHYWTPWLPHEILPWERRTFGRNFLGHSLHSESKEN
jgi:hypothetical protein